MASGLLYYDGYEDFTTIQDWYVDLLGSVTINTTGARSGAGCIRFLGASGNYGRARRQITATTTPIAGVGYFQESNFGNSLFLLSYYEGTTLHLDLRVGTTGVLTVTRNGTVLATGNTTLLVNTWYYIEFKAVIHDSTGSFDVYINGVLETWASGSNSGVDTRNGGTGVVNRVQLAGATASAISACRMDDFYVVDGTVGGATFLGDIRVDSYLPDGAGDDADFSPSAGSNHENVDDAAPDGDTTYNESATPGDKDTFSLPNTPGSGAAIYGAAHIMRARKTDAGTRELRGLLKSAGGTTANQTTRSQSDSYVSHFEHNETEPGGAAWDETKVNGLKVGYEVVT